MRLISDFFATHESRICNHMSAFNQKFQVPFTFFCLIYLSPIIHFYNVRFSDVFKEYSNGTLE